MPIQLSNGLVLYNVTPHPLHFQTKDGVVTAPSDGILDALPVVHNRVFTELYTLATVKHVPKPDRVAWLRGIRRVHPHAIIVGSMIAARAYPEFVVAGVPVKKADRYPKSDVPIRMRSDRFTFFPSEKGLDNGFQE